MFIADDFIFLELEKTASTHIARLLAQIMLGSQQGKHNRLTQPLALSQRKILGAVRNPWDWYVSLWSYSCGTYGGLYARQTSWSIRGYGLRAHPWIGISSILHQFTRSSRMWKHLYSDVQNPELFRQWLIEMYNPKRKHDIGNGYAQSSLSDFSGYLTFMYMYLFARDVKRLFRKKVLTGNQDLSSFDQENIHIDHVIHVENLEEDLIDALQQMCIDLKEDDLHLIRSRKPTNTSARKRSLGRYYDQQTIELVEERERFFIERFGYQKPDLAVGV